ncbi:hypothetical protein C8Q69DRAFT_453531 [Paecilomyces variotii]|uniref:Zn(2)-C6 fungal-type domain-containing protein n=1 Tax=Byssochlamys spectabilis TaxID=264951 RepID=A0A443I7M8_BYSSP|nr:hypothetical protein C8Q69DRAFT_453531 [Paecilomyces variotii]KAJ9254114.1 transcriptional regulator family: Fungal Specific TF [Paecilomyces variotii]KAJ9357754.1 transcriptional regulator family: Fungal Specific TF [Paecilomyces variotii]RWR00063.1 hypothetical protein C8Q69DRAFT_453531 [Paecilomyces variotii]
MKVVCVQCRIRKVRCKGEQPACSNCRRLKFPCSFKRIATEPASVEQAFDAPRKCRGSRACAACRSQKTRCSGERPACSNCERRGRPCVYRNEEAQNAIVSDINGSLPPIPDMDGSSGLLHLQAKGRTLDPRCGSADTLATTDRMSNLITIFFERIFPLPSYSFLHPATVKKRFQEGVLDEALKLTICAITKLYIWGRSSSSDTWADESQELLLQNISRPSVLHLQALLLLVRYRAGAGDFSSAFLLAGLAARSAVGLRLNYDRSDLGPIAQEVRRRTFWSLYLLDDIFSVGLEDFELCRPEIIHLQLPSDDIDFMRERYIRTGSLESDGDDGSDNIGFRGLFLRVAFIRRAIMRFNRKVQSGSFDPSTLSMSTERFSKQLGTMEAQLKSLDMSTMIDVADDRWDPPIVMLRLSLHQSYCDLYRIFLTGYPEAAPQSAIEQISLPDREAMQDKCLHHAHAISQTLVDFAESREGTQILDYDAAVCTYHSLRLMLFFASTRPGYSRIEKQTVIERAKACVNITLQLFHFLEPVKPMIADLERLLHCTTSSMLAAFSPPPILQVPQAAKVAREASTRQRLSIHSLLHQADFVDDSPQAADSAADNIPLAMSHVCKNNRAGNTSDGSIGPSYSSNPRNPEPHMGPSSLIFNAWMGFPSVEERAGQLEGFAEDF